MDQQSAGTSPICHLVAFPAHTLPCSQQQLRHHSLSFSSWSPFQAVPLPRGPLLPLSSLSPPHPSVLGPPAPSVPSAVLGLCDHCVPCPPPSQIPSLSSLKARAESMISPEPSSRSSPDPGTVLVTRSSLWQVHSSLALVADKTRPKADCPFVRRQFFTLSPNTPPNTTSLLSLELCWDTSPRATSLPRVDPDQEAGCVPERQETVPPGPQPLPRPDDGGR